MKTRIRWGVLGSGGIARRRTIPEGLLVACNATLVSVCGADSRRNSEVAREFGVEAADSLEAMLDSGIDAVYIGTPPDGHLDQVRRCAEAGKHVLCEKPLGRTVDEAERMVACCAQRRVTLGTAFMMRFHAQHLAAWEIVRAGRLGRPVFARAQLSCWHPNSPRAWRHNPLIAGGGSLIDMGGHCLDLLEFYFDAIKRVTCLSRRTVQDGGTEDSAVVTVGFENGALGVVDAFFCIPDEASPNALELYGSKGSILAKGTMGQESRGTMIAHLLDDAMPYDPRQARVASHGVAIEPAPVNTYKAEIEEFSQAIIEGREPLNSAALGLRNQRLIEACYEAARSGKTVELWDCGGTPQGHGSAVGERK